MTIHNHHHNDNNNGSFSNNNCFLLIFLSLHSKRSIDIKQIIDIIEFDDNWTAKTKNIIQTKTFSTNFSICLFLLMITLVNFCFVLFIWLHIDIFPYIQKCCLAIQNLYHFSMNLHGQNAEEIKLFSLGKTKTSNEMNEWWTWFTIYLTTATTKSIRCDR